MLKIIPRFNLNTTSYDIVLISNDSWKPVSGPYLTKDEALTDLRNIENESMCTNDCSSNNELLSI